MAIITLKRIVIVQAMRLEDEVYPIKAKALIGELEPISVEPITGDGRIAIYAYEAVTSDSPHPIPLGTFKKSLNAWMEDAKRYATSSPKSDFDWAREQFWSRANRNPLRVEIPESNVDGVA